MMKISTPYEFWLGVNTMMTQTYRHQIIRLNGATQQTNKYQLQVVALSQQGEPIHRANWNFATFRGLTTFLHKHFPDSPILNQTAIQFHVLPSLQDS